MIMKRSVSPDGRIDSISVEFSLPVSGCSNGDIKQRALSTLELQKEIVGAFLKLNGPKESPVLTHHEEALKGAKPKSRFRLYDLRHTFGSRPAMAGVELATLKELMGHSNISITMRYVHPTPEHKQEALRKLERFNVEEVFAMHEKRSGSPQKSPQSEMHQNGASADVLVN